TVRVRLPKIVVAGPAARRTRVEILGGTGTKAGGKADRLVGTSCGRTQIAHVSAGRVAFNNPIAARPARDPAPISHCVPAGRPTPYLPAGVGGSLRVGSRGDAAGSPVEGGPRQPTGELRATVRP